MLPLLQPKEFSSKEPSHPQLTLPNPLVRLAQGCNLNFDGGNYWWKWNAKGTLFQASGVSAGGAPRPNRSTNADSLAPFGRSAHLTASASGGRKSALAQAAFSPFGLDGRLKIKPAAPAADGAGPELRLGARPAPDRDYSPGRPGAGRSSKAGLQAWFGMISGWRYPRSAPEIELTNQR